MPIKSLFLTLIITFSALYIYTDYLQICSLGLSARAEKSNKNFQKLIFIHLRSQVFFYAIAATIETTMRVLKISINIHNHVLNKEEHNFHFFQRSMRSFQRREHTFQHARTIYIYLTQHTNIKSTLATLQSQNYGPLIIMFTSIT